MRIRLETGGEDRLEAVKMAIHRHLPRNADSPRAHGSQLAFVTECLDERVRESRGARRISWRQITIDPRPEPFANATDVECDRGNAERRRFESHEAERFGPAARERQQRRLLQRGPAVVTIQPARRGEGQIALRRAPLPYTALGTVADQQQAN